MKGCRFWLNTLSQVIVFPENMVVSNPDSQLYVAAAVVKRPDRVTRPAREGGFAHAAPRPPGDRYPHGLVTRRPAPVEYTTTPRCHDAALPKEMRGWSGGSLPRRAGKAPLTRTAMDAIDERIPVGSFPSMDPGEAAPQRRPGRPRLPPRHKRQSRPSFPGKYVRG